MEQPMARGKIGHGAGYGFHLHSPGWHLDLPVVIALAAAPGLVLVWLLPLPLVPPALSMVSCIIAGCVAALAYYAGAGRHTDGITLWDVAGAFALIWVAAGMLSEPAHVAALFDHLTMAE
jgi:hypothetical protein